MQGFALNNISDCYIGSNQASAIYLGSTLIWPTTPPPPHDYSQDYLTVEFYNTNLSHRIQYADKGGTIYYNFPDIDTNWSAITGGHLDTEYSKVRLKGNLVPETTDPSGTGTNYGIGTITIRDISSSGNNISFVYGNIMSLLYGDNFINQTSLSGYDYAFAHLFENNMIYDAQNLILPNDTTIGCYYNMFFYNPYLVYAPILNAQILNEVSYEGMFNGCTSLHYIKCLATDISAPSCTYHWLNNVSSTGTFVKDANTTWPTGASGIPSGWTIDPPIQHDYSQDYLTIVSTSNNNTISFKVDNVSAIFKTINVSTDNGTTWVNYTSSYNGTNIATLNTGDKLLIKGTNTVYGNVSNDACNYFTSSGTFEVEGNIMSLIYGNYFVGQTTLSTDYTFKRLFYQASGLTNAKNLVLPATTLTTYCYSYMFNGCTSLTTAPETLPATTLATGCYSYMFYDCTSLTTASILSATTLASSCCMFMFRNCSSLITAPILHATTLQTLCYNGMFWGCTSLTTAPELNALTLTDNCYRNMFNSCSSLNYIKCLATNISASNCTNSWVSGVSASGTFVKNASMTNWTTGISGIPSGWTVQNA